MGSPVVLTDTVASKLDHSDLELSAAFFRLGEEQNRMIASCSKSAMPLR